MNIRNCFWCGARRDRRMFSHLRSPTRFMIKLMPCGACATEMVQGITLMEARGKATPHPTGYWTVITVERAKAEFNINVDAGVTNAFVDVKSWTTHNLPRVKRDRRAEEARDKQHG